MIRRSLPVRALRAIWVSAPVRAIRQEIDTRRALATTRRERKAQQRHLAACERGRGQGLKPGPIVVSGFLDEAIGIGRGGRLTADALEAAGFQVIRHNIRPAIVGGARDTFPLPGTHGVWLMHYNAPEALKVFEVVRTEDLYGRYRIGYWAWELPRAPDSWLEAASFFDEIWTPSQFTADSLKDCGRPVRVMPHPTPAKPPPPTDRSRFGMRDGVVEFLAMADLRSSAARKNPLGAIRAFVRAFPRAQDAAALTVKIVHPDADPAAMAALREAAGGRRDIRLLDEELSTAEVEQLVAAADVVLSLHRSEGFGLTLSEALGMGRAALATGWSGNLEFMSGLPEALLPYRFIDVEDPSGAYVGQQWADADLDAAAERIHRLTADAELRAEIGSRGRAAVARLAQTWTREALQSSAISRWSRPG